MHDGSLFLASSLYSACLCGFEKKLCSNKPVLVGFLYTCVSIFVRFLIVSMPIKDILLSTGSSIVKDRLGWRLLRVVRKSTAASVLGILAKVLSTYLL